MDKQDSPHAKHSPLEQASPPELDTAGRLQQEAAFRPWHDPEPRPACCPHRHAIVRTTGLSVHFGNETALQDINLSINQGCITAVVGPSGCGKSTFLTTLNRMTELTAEARVQGQVHLDDAPVYTDGVDLPALRRRVGLIAQRPAPFPLSIRRNIDFPLREHGVRRRDAREAILEDSLRRVGLWDEVRHRLEASALTLSGGQQQRLCLARALALEPEVLLMDEPCSALDPLASAVVEDLIASVRGRYTVVIVTHNLAQARRIADDMALFWHQDGAGRLIEAGPAERLFTEPARALTRAYISGARG